MMRARIGTVPYLNAAPLVAGLDGDDQVELVEATPARLGPLLGDGSLDVGLVPVAEAARLHLFGIAGAAVAAAGAVRSVLLLYRVPLAAITRLALDPASRTSQALVRLLLERDHGLRPKLVDGPGTGDPLPADADAGLVIGDRALLRAPAAGISRIDLGFWWWQRTGLPFVFALWAGRDRTTVAELAPRLLAARSEGLAHLDRVARSAARRRGIPGDLASDYLRESISFDLAGPERDGLDRFLRESVESALLPATSTLEFV